MKLETAKSFFTEKMKFKENEVFAVEQVLMGASNDVFIVRTKSNSYYLRMTKENPLINRNDEKIILDKLSIKYFYYDELGNYIRLWINATYNKSWNTNKLESISDFLHKMHALKLKDFTKFDYRQYESFIVNSKYKNCYALYLKLLAKYKDLPLVVCHNDLNPTNILCQYDNIIVVDYERTQLNTVYFDLANLAREDMSIDQVKHLCKYNKLDYNIFIDHLVITCIYGLQWTLTIASSKELIVYQNNVLSRLEMFLELAGHFI